MISAGTISQSSGTISAATLTGKAAGAVTLGATANAIATLGSFNTGTFDFALVNGSSLGVSGPVSAQDVTLTTESGGIDFAGSVTAMNTVPR